MRRIPNTMIAAHINKSDAWVGRVLNGWQAPSPEFRRVVAELTGLPEHELFRAAQAWFAAELAESA